MKTQRLLGCACGAVLLSLAAYAGDWPQWRGPQRNGVSSETGLLKEWPKEGPFLQQPGFGRNPIPLRSAPLRPVARVRRQGKQDSAASTAQKPLRLHDSLPGLIVE